jgi:large subunit ribosomal protein L31
MKNNIHPKYFEKAKIECSCGASFEVGSTTENIKVEICSNCHPAYTGNKKLIDSAGRVDRFKARLEKSKKLKLDVDSNKKKLKSKKSPENLESKKTN